MRSGILIDLYNTLLPSGDDGRVATVREMAVLMGVDPDAFIAEVRRSWPERLLGVHGDLMTETAELAARIGASPSPDALEAAVQRRYAFARAHVVPPTSTLDALHALRRAGHSVAIVSNCTFDSAVAIRETPLADAVDALVLSCEVHIGKPDPKIYLMACAALSLEPAECAYLGDGADGELPGAAALGMHVVQTTQYATSDPTWHGPRITSLDQILALLP
jgi:putative hydrolase of the HAD superfamily